MKRIIRIILNFMIFDILLLPVLLAIMFVSWVNEENRNVFLIKQWLNPFEDIKGTVVSYDHNTRKINYDKN